MGLDTVSSSMREEEPRHVPFFQNLMDIIGSILHVLFTPWLQWRRVELRPLRFRIIMSACMGLLILPSSFTPLLLNLLVNRAITNDSGEIPAEIVVSGRAGMTWRQSHSGGGALPAPQAGLMALLASSGIKIRLHEILSRLAVWIPCGLLAGLLGHLALGVLLTIGAKIQRVVDRDRLWCISCYAVILLSLGGSALSSLRLVFATKEEPSGILIVLVVLLSSWFIGGIGSLVCSLDDNNERISAMDRLSACIVVSLAVLPVLLVCYFLAWGPYGWLFLRQLERM